MPHLTGAPPEPNAYAAGRAAFAKRKDVHAANPYKPGSREHKQFIKGYTAAQTEAILSRQLPDWASLEAMK